MAEKAHIPVYLPDNTVIGRATVDLESGVATIQIQSDSNLIELIQESLVGLSVVYMSREAAVVPNEGEKTDDTP